METGGWREGRSEGEGEERGEKRREEEEEEGEQLYPEERDWMAKTEPFVVASRTIKPQDGKT